MTSYEQSGGVAEETEQQSVDVAHSCANVWDVMDLKKFCNFRKVTGRHLKKFGSVQYRYDLDMAPIPSALTPETSMRVIPKILESAF